MVNLKGRSGSGKSTLLAIIGLLDKPTEGEVELFGRPAPTRVGPRSVLRRRNIGYLFQDSGLIDRMSAIENVKLPLRLSGLPTNLVESLGMEALEKVGLSTRSRHLPSELSGGERQRVGLARVLALRPKLIICDEPTGALDAESSHMVMSSLSSLVDSGSAAIVANHDDVVDGYCAAVWRMSEGKLVL